MIALMLSWGCSQEQQPAEQKRVSKAAVAPKQREVKEAPKESLKELEEAKEEWRYDATDKWDPFVIPPPPIIAGESSERYDLDQMLLMGIIRGSGMDAAYIRLPDGTDRIIRIGDILGKHGGEVKDIGKDFLIVEERYMDPKRPNDTFIIEKELRLE